MPEAEGRLLSKVGLIQSLIYSSGAKIHEWCMRKAIIKNPITWQYMFLFVIVHSSYAMLLSSTPWNIP